MVHWYIDKTRLLLLSIAELTLAEMILRIQVMIIRQSQTRMRATIKFRNNNMAQPCTPG